MSIKPRWPAIALAITMLQMSVVRAEGACASHTPSAGGTSFHEPPQPPLVPQSPEHDGMDHRSEAPDESERCDTPAQDCCRALASCAGVLDMDHSIATVPPRLADADVVASIAAPPPSLATAPEPPPPRA